MIREPWIREARTEGERKDERRRDRRKGRSVEKEERNPPSHECLSIRPSVRLFVRPSVRPSGRAKRVPSFFSRWIVIRIQGRSGECSRRCTPNAECRWKLRGINEYIFQLGGGPHSDPSGRRPDIRLRPALNDCPELSYDIYFIGVSLPSSMMIYNCCRLDYNYYNYRFFVGLSPGRPSTPNRLAAVLLAPSLFVPAPPLRIFFALLALSRFYLLSPFVSPFLSSTRKRVFDTT